MRTIDNFLSRCSTLLIRPIRQFIDSVFEYWISAKSIVSWRRSQIWHTINSFVNPHSKLPDTDDDVHQSPVIPATHHLKLCRYKERMHLIRSKSYTVWNRDRPCSGRSDVNEDKSPAISHSTTPTTSSTRRSIQLDCHRRACSAGQCGIDAISSSNWIQRFYALTENGARKLGF